MVADSLRADHLSCYGYNKPTPNIDHLADNGTIFLDTWAAGSNTPASIPYLLSDYMLLNLKKRGYRCTLIHSNVNLKTAKTLINKIDLHREGKINKILTLALKGEYCPWSRAEAVNKVALQYLEHIKQPHFLCLWYMDTHLPYIPQGSGIYTFLINKKLRKAAATREYRKITKQDIASFIDLYDSEIKYLDTCIGAFVKNIDLDKTRLIFTADHGEEFMEHGDLGHQNKDIPELRHVPLITNDSIGWVKERFDFKNFDKWILNLEDRK